MTAFAVRPPQLPEPTAGPRHRAPETAGDDRIAVPDDLSGTLAHGRHAAPDEADDDPRAGDLLDRLGFTAPR